MKLKLKDIKVGDKLKVGVRVYLVLAKGITIILVGQTWLTEKELNEYGYQLLKKPKTKKCKHGEKYLTGSNGDQWTACKLCDTNTERLSFKKSIVAFGELGDIPKMTPEQINLIANNFDHFSDKKINRVFRLSKHK